jgi:zinc transporter, ZIP family
MSFLETALLGGIAGITIYLGLPVGRVRRIDERLRVALAMFSAGILAFIFMDVSAHAETIVDSTLGQFKNGHTGFFHVLWLFALLAAGFVAGTAGIAGAERALMGRRRAPRPPIAGAAVAATLTADEAARLSAEGALARAAALRTGMTIAFAIGLHNFAEGLAIGVSARAGAVGLATVLIIGFALHNATEGFGIVGPLGGIRPSWRWLGLAGLVGGGPTFVGAMVGFQVHSNPLELLFYALAGGAILYVIGEIWAAVRRYEHRELGLYLLAAGFLLGVATDLIVSYGGA